MTNAIKKSQLILLEFNELNIEIAIKYIRENPKIFPSFTKLLKFKRIKTISEINYNNIEPWIQWPSIHTGKTFQEHKIHKLGDCIYSSIEQIYELLEKNGINVAAISPINASNNLVKSNLFIPDPWSNVSTDGSLISRKLHAAIKTLVNNNASSTFDIKSILTILILFIWLIKISNFKIYLKILIGILCGKKWYKALFLDYFLHTLHIKYLKKYFYDFSSIFFNAGAHIQHHYFFNSKFIKSIKNKNPDWYISKNHDPIFDMLQIYESILNNYFKLNSYEFIVANGLSQIPYDRIKFYYRLKCHGSFLNKLKIKFRAVYPRMSRDFLCEFDSLSDKNNSINILNSIINISNKKHVFSINNDVANPLSIFVTLSYDEEITKDDLFTYGNDNTIHNFFSEIVFVAIKNGMHCSLGDAFYSEGMTSYVSKGNNVSEIFYSIKNFFLK